MIGGENNEELLLNISPDKFEKPKDQLFIDFFSMYTNRFVQEESNQEAAATSGPRNSKMQLETGEQRQSADQSFSNKNEEDSYNSGQGQ